MRQINFVTGLRQAIIGWTTLNFHWVIVDTTWPQDETAEVFMGDIVAYEFAATGYSRVAMTSPSVALNLPVTVDTRGFIGYVCDDPVFAAMTGGQQAGALVLINTVTNDADSPIVACTPVVYTANGFAPTFATSATGTIKVPTTC